MSGRAAGEVPRTHYSDRTLQTLCCSVQSKDQQANGRRVTPFAAVYQKHQGITGPQHPQGTARGK